MDQVRIGNASVDFTSLTIEGDAGTFSVEPKVLEVLRALIEQDGQVVGRDTLIDQVWGVGFGGDERLSRAVSLLRKALGDKAGSHQYIETIPKRGYRLVATVEIVGSKSDSRSSKVDDNEVLTSSDSFGSSSRLMLFAIIALAFVGATFIYFNADTSPKQTASDGSEAFANKNSIAVLPFADLSAQSDQQYLADGLAEEILNAVIKFPDIRVVGQTSSFRFRNGANDLATISETLGVSHILTGAVRKQGDQVRITAKLLQTDNGAVIWSESYDDTIDDIFDLQENIARTLAEKLDVSLNNGKPERLAPQLTDNQEAYDLFLQGRELSRRFGRNNKSKSVELLEQAVSIDPEFAAAWAWIARTKMLLAITTETSKIHTVIDEARAATNRALAIDPDSAMGHYAQSLLHDYDLDIAASLDSIEKAFASDPNQPFLMIRRGNYYLLLGQSEKAERMIEEGLRRDPTDSAGLLNLAQAKSSLGKLDEAQALMNRSIDLGFVPAQGWLCGVLNYTIDGEAAANCWRNLPEIWQNRFKPVIKGPDDWNRMADAIYLGDREKRQYVIDLLDAHFGKPNSKSNGYLVAAYLNLNVPERFMSAYVEHRYPVNAAGISSIWLPGKRTQDLRRHEKFPAFAERIGLVRAWQKYGWPANCTKEQDTDGTNGRFSCL